MLMNMGDEVNDIKRVVISEEELLSFNKEALLKIWMRQEKYISSLEQKHLAEVKELESKLQTALHDGQRKEDLMVMRLNTKEQELQDYMSQISEMKSSSASSAVRNLLLDPAVNFVIEKLKRELCDTKAKLEETQSELSAWKFTPDSQTGKRLMAKCRLLHQENEDLGKVVASGKLAKLETELALQRNLAEEMKKSQSEMDEFVQELDEDVEGMQSTIMFLQQQLREAKALAAAGVTPGANGTSSGQPAPPPPTAAAELNGHAEPESEEQPEPEPEQEPEPEPVRRASPEPVKKPAPEPAPVKKPAQEPAPVKLPAPEPMKKYAPEPVKKAAPEPTKMSAPEQPVKKTTPEPVKKPASEPTKKLAPESAADPEPPRTAVTAGGAPPEPAAPPDPPAAAEPELPERSGSPEPVGRRRRRRPEQPETGASPEPGRTKRRAATLAEDSPGRRAKRTRSSDDGGAPAAAD